MEHVSTSVGAALAQASEPVETPEQAIARLQAELAEAKSSQVKGRESGKVALGTNIQHSLKGSILTLTIDLSKRGGPSASGKSFLVASTHGNQQIAGVRIGVNAYASNN